MGQVTVYGNLPKEFLPSVILRGMSLPVADILKQQGLTDQMLDAVSWPPRSQTLSGNTAVAQTFRSISGYKWPDDPSRSVRASPPECPRHGHHAALNLTVTVLPMPEHRKGPRAKAREYSTLHLCGSSGSAENDWKDAQT
jgi:hypothetical protein